jgi:hypothetical protein
VPPPVGRRLMRNVAMTFDAAYVDAQSRTVAMSRVI